MIMIRVFNAAKRAFWTVCRVLDRTHGHTGVRYLMLFHMPLPSITGIHMLITLMTPMGMTMLLDLRITFGKVTQRSGIAHRAPGSAVAGTGTLSERHERSN